MAKGITQSQVDTAADALVQAGERPTVERIRAFLGTGSPNTVTRMLETWWQALGARLASQQERVTLPEAPAAVADLASQLWEQALLAARTYAQAELADARSTLEAERVELERARQTARDAEAAASATSEAAQQAQALAEARLAESQRLIDHQATQLADVSRQRDTLTEQTAGLEQTVLALRDRLQTQETTAATERERQAQHVRVVEDRAHAEIDRVREEARTIRRDHEAAAHEHAAAMRSMRQELGIANAAVGEARREAVREQARAQALEEQLAKLADLPTLLEAALARTQSPRMRSPKLDTSKRAGSKKSNR